MTHIILADDSAFQRRILTRYLEDAGYDVQVAENGQGVLDLLQNTTPDCILIDLIMPEVSGHDVLRYLYQHQNKIPVIVSTADIQRTTYEECIALGAFEVIAKPVNKDNLVDLIEQALERAL